MQPVTSLQLGDCLNHSTMNPYFYSNCESIMNEAIQVEKNVLTKSSVKMSRFDAGYRVINATVLQQ